MQIKQSFDESNPKGRNEGYEVSLEKL